MKCFLLDTNTVSAATDKLNSDHTKIMGYLNNLDANDCLFICRVVAAEIEYGHKVFLASDPNRRKLVEKAIGIYQTREINRHTTNPYSDIRSAVFSKYSPRDKRKKMRIKQPESLVDRTTGKELGIQENDLWIAAVAAEHNMILLTADRGFDHIKKAWPSLLVDYWK